MSALPSLSRRQFMQATAAGVAGLPFAERLQAQEQLPAYEGPLKGIKFTDQHGAEFDPAKALAGRPHLLVFGYEGCPFCEGKITKTVAAVQARTGLPVVVVTIHPENDHDKLQDYAQKYSELGVRQLAGEGREDGKIAFIAARDKPQREHTLHILIARNEAGEPKNDIALQAHKNTGQAYDAENTNSHTPMLVLCDGQGKIVAKKFAAIDDKNAAGRLRVADEINAELQKIVEPRR